MSYQLDQHTRIQNIIRFAEIPVIPLKPFQSNEVVCSLHFPEIKREVKSFSNEAKFGKNIF